MPATRDDTVPLPRAIRDLEQVLHAKLQRALELGAADTHGGRTDVSPHIVLSGDIGAVRASVGTRGMRLLVSQVPQEHYIVDVTGDTVRLVGGDGPQPQEAEAAALALSLTELVTPLEVAPQVQVPYGLVAGGEIAGITFMTEVDVDSEGAGRDDLGLNMDTYFARDPRGLFPFASEASAAGWLTGFWRAAAEGRVISLSERIGRLAHGFWACRDGADVWLELGGTDGITPVLVAGDPYRSWDPGLGAFSKRVRRGEDRQRNRLNGWFR